MVPYVCQTSINDSAVTTAINCCFENESLAVVDDYAIAAAAVFVNGCDRAKNLRLLRACMVMSQSIANCQTSKLNLACRFHCLALG